MFPYTNAHQYSMYDHVSMKDQSLSLADIFVGCGGLSLGFLRKGFKIIAGLDNFKEAISSFEFNFKDSKGYFGSIEDQDFVDAFCKDMKKKALDGLIAGVPCQSYSMAGNRDVLERRAYYYLDYFDIINRLKPRFFVLENVPGLLSMRVINPDLIEIVGHEVKLKSNVPEIATLARLRRYKDLNRYSRQRELTSEELVEYTPLDSEFGELRNWELMAELEGKGILVKLYDNIELQASLAGYGITSAVLDSKFFGSAQSRKRVFIVGFRYGILENKPGFQFPRGHAFCNSCNDRVEVTKAGECPIDSSHELLFRTTQEAIGDLEDKPENYLPNHEFTKHAEAFKKRLHAVKPGETLYENFTDAWYRLKPDSVSRTIKENHQASAIHYSQDRVITVREMMRLQDFPDDFKLIGKKTKTNKLVGNAVDINVSSAMAEAIKEFLDG